MPGYFQDFKIAKVDTNLLVFFAEEHCLRWGARPSKPLRCEYVPGGFDSYLFRQKLRLHFFCALPAFSFFHKAPERTSTLCWSKKQSLYACNAVRRNYGEIAALCRNVHTRRKYRGRLSLVIRCLQQLLCNFSLSVGLTLRPTRWRVLTQPLRVGGAAVTIYSRWRSS